MGQHTKPQLELTYATICPSDSRSETRLNCTQGLSFLSPPPTLFLLFLSHTHTPHVADTSIYGRYGYRTVHHRQSAAKPHISTLYVPPQPLPLPTNCTETFLGGAPFGKTSCVSSAGARTIPRWQDARYTSHRWGKQIRHISCTENWKTALIVRSTKTKKQTSSKTGKTGGSRSRHVWCTVLAPSGPPHSW